jgi:hypothetical protein
VPPRKAGRHATNRMKITTERLTCTAPRVLKVLKRVFDAPGVDGRGDARVQNETADLAEDCVGVHTPETRNPKPETRNPKPETRNPKPEIQPRPETRNPKPETRNPEPETRNPKPEIQPRPETRIPNPESRIPQPETRNSYAPGSQPSSLS